jgi:hypothetical protein
MNFLDYLFFGGTINAIFRLGFIPKKEEFYELTPEQYAKYYANNEQTERKIFMLLPDDPQKYSKVASGDVFVIEEDEIPFFEHVGKLMDECCQDSGKTFETFDEKLYYLAENMPPMLSGGTKYAKDSSLYLSREDGWSF